MTFPKVKHSAVLATLDKATQTPPDAYAAAALLELTESQPDLTQAITILLLRMFGNGTTPEGKIEPISEESEPVPVEVAQEMAIMATFCILGISLKAINAQVESDEMEKAWG
tara:strand:+ start:149 stop:484 length:336 start_codon:yes stop_codon:yes gene_type:complete